MLPPQQVLRNLCGFFKNSGNFAIFTAIRRASSRVSSFGRRSPPRLLLETDVGKLLAGAVLHDEGGVDVLDRPRAPGSALAGCTPVELLV